MSFLSTSKMNRRDVSRLFNAWRETMPNQADRFASRVWGHVPGEPLDLRFDLVEPALRYLKEHIVLVEETPEGDLPLWLRPGKFHLAPFPTAPDRNSAWLLDEYACWLTTLMLHLWRGSELVMFKSSMGGRDSGHNMWEVRNGLDFIEVVQMVSQATSLAWPEDGPPLAIERVVDGLALRLSPSGTRHSSYSEEDPYDFEVNPGDEMFHIGVTRLDSLSGAGLPLHHITLPWMEYVRGRRRSEHRADIEQALATLPAVSSVGWEDYDVAIVEGEVTGADLLAIAVSILDQNRGWLSSL